MLKDLQCNANDCSSKKSCLHDILGVYFLRSRSIYSWFDCSCLWSAIPGHINLQTVLESFFKRRRVDKSCSKSLFLIILASSTLLFFSWALKEPGSFLRESLFRNFLHRLRDHTNCGQTDLQTHFRLLLIFAIITNRLQDSRLLPKEFIFWLRALVNYRLPTRFHRLW